MILKNSNFGFTLQKTICDTFSIIPTSEQCIHIFESNFDKSISDKLGPLINKIFNSIGFKPIECTTLTKQGSSICPYNFILSNKSTLSIRTNTSSNKVAPRIIGQAGYEKLNLFFSKIYGNKINNQSDIKKLFIEKIDNVLPVFVDNLFDADIIVWISKKDDNFEYEIIDGKSSLPFDYSFTNFSFTRNLQNWNESNTLKYKGTTIAEIQVHKNRTFKFRFNMNSLMPIIIKNISTNETIGITAEKTICDLFNLDYPHNLNNRYSKSIQNELIPVIKDAFNILEKPIKYVGNLKGERGNQSKSSYDFILSQNKTLSVKTNIGKMVCPPEVGQPSAKTCYYYFKHLIPKENHIDSQIFKQMTFDSITELVKIYAMHLFDSDYLLRIFKENSNFKYQIFPKEYAKNIEWEKNKFSFSQTLKNWNESNTLYYDSLPIGEFQIHKNRNCYKFRFNFENLVKLIKKSK